ncbi:hypothetical protein CSUI_010633 [Cystoisospora suis]|uniref:Uncharacterized protein n=1 Tax=Cystoisospora suis TaxID=483139 RepID=A0A2C6KGU4_9APIC|nr:hypothetical protein CSUI_010633 [Cystoisospora suis]
MDLTLITREKEEEESFQKGKMKFFHRIDSLSVPLSISSYQCPSRVWSEIYQSLSLYMCVCIFRILMCIRPNCLSVYRCVCLSVSLFVYRHLCSYLRI